MALFENRVLVAVIRKDESGCIRVTLYPVTGVLKGQGGGTQRYTYGEGCQVKTEADFGVRQRQAEEHHALLRALRC